MLPVNETHAHVGEVLVHPSGKMIGTIKAAMPAARTAEAYAQVGEFPFHVVPDVRCHKLLYTGKKDLDLSLGLKEFHDGSIGTGKALVLLIPSGVMHSTAVKYVSASVFGSGNAILV